MRTLLLVLALLAPSLATAQPVAQNLNLAVWLRQVRALGDNASEAAHRHLALRFDPDLAAVCGGEPTGWVEVKPVTSTALLVTLGCIMGARRLSVAPYVMQQASGRWRARRLQVQSYSENSGQITQEATMMGDVEVSGRNVVFTEFYGADGFTSYLYRLPTLSEPPVFVLLRVTEGSVGGPSRVVYRRRGNR